MKDLTIKIKSELVQTLSRDIDRAFSTSPEMDATAEKITSIFEEIPVTFRQFVEGKDHMNVEPLSDRQYMPAEFLLGSDPTKIFDNGNTTAVCEWGKGSGKDHIASLVILYIVYVLLCMKSPQKFLKLNEGEWIDLLNVAISGEQASGIFFEKFRQRILRWTWLKDKYSVKLSGVYLGQIKKQAIDEKDNIVTLTRDAVLFPKLIRAISGHSKGETQEGHGILCFVLDEASGFDSPEKIYNTLRTSAVSRFGDRYKCFLLSFPRYHGDFIEKMFEESLKELHWYGDKASTWEIKPASCFSGKWFNRNGEQIPLEYKKDFEKAPEDSDAKYRCLPQHIENPFIERPDKVDSSIDYSGQKVIFSDFIENGYVMKKLIKVSTDSRMIERIVTMDLGVKNNSAALSIFHKELSPDGRAIFIQDCSVAWEPNEAEKLMVSFPNIKDIIVELKEKLNITKVYFDQWQSVMMVQELSAAGIQADVYHLDFDDYKNFKEKLYLDQVKLQNDMTLVQELKKLKILKGNRVDHPKTGSKDRADTVVGAIRVLSGKGGGGYTQMGNDGEFVGFNLGSEGNFIK